MWGALPDESSLQLYNYNYLASAVILRSESRGTHDNILLSQIRDFPNSEGQDPVYIYIYIYIYPHRKRVAQTLGSLFVAS
jgi:hypothetical protein